MNFTLLKSFSLGILMAAGLQGFSQANNEKPKLVVGVVVDQMRYDYLTRFANHYGNDGFKRLQRDGFDCQNNHFNYAPTYTGPGHACIVLKILPLNL